MGDLRITCLDCSDGPWTDVATAHNHADDNGHQVVDCYDGTA